MRTLMRIIVSPTRFAVALLAAGVIVPGLIAPRPALADDSNGEGIDRMVPGMTGNLPGVRATGASMQRPGAENPEMRSFRLAPAAPAQAAATAPEPLPAAPALAASSVAASMPEVDRLLQGAEAELRSHHSRHGAREADGKLEQAETALLNAQAAGLAVPAGAMTPLLEARTALRRGNRDAAERATEAAERAVSHPG
ncbi:MAG: hypothetical protein JWP04_3910 [Belnapia sp.]|nr:hypothetical protein [Belnapia sp.]